MFDGPDPTGFDIDSGVHVGYPAVPELARHSEELLLGAAVAVGVVETAAAPKVCPGERV
jgi:hypothetical protein